MNNLNMKIMDSREDFEQSNSFFLEGNFIKPGDSFLDIGGATGKFINFINQEISPVQGTVLEIDQECIDLGMKNYPEIHFCQMKFPDQILEGQYDIVSMQFLFPHLKDWKRSIREMVKLSKRYINFSAIVQEYGRTIDDDEVSYFYYLNTGERKAQVILNICEIVNFLCLQELRVKSIHFSGTYSLDLFTPSLVDCYEKVLNREEIPETMLCEIRNAHLFRGIFPFDQINGSFTIELFDKKDNPKRMGGAGKSDREKYLDDYKFFIPDISINIQGVEFWGVREGKTFFNLGSLVNSPRFLNVLRIVEFQKKEGLSR